MSVLVNTKRWQGKSSSTVEVNSCITLKTKKVASLATFFNES